MSNSVSPWTAAHQPSLSSLFAEMHVHWVSDAIQAAYSLSSSPPSFNLSQHQVFSSESALHIRWPKYWSVSFSISPSNEYSGLISFRIDWFDLLAIQGTLKSLLQYHSSKAPVLQDSDFFIVQLSHPYMTTGKTTTLTRLAFAGKVVSLLFNMLSMFVIAFLSSFNFMGAVTIHSDFGAQEIKSVTVSIVFPSFAMMWWNWMPWS